MAQPVYTCSYTLHSAMTILCSHSGAHAGKAAGAPSTRRAAGTAALSAKRQMLEVIYTEENMLSTGCGPSRKVACSSNHFIYYGPVPNGSELRIGIIKYRCVKPKDTPARSFCRLTAISWLG